MLFVCPKCKGKLNISNTGTAVCSLGHSFDRSREGYYNLLLSRGGGTHGDNAEMVKARRAFLSYGYYEPMARAVAETACAQIEPSGVLLDAGLGEGYYTSLVADALSKRCEKSKETSPRVCGFDISKEAVRQAAKRHAGLMLAVASSYDMPIASGSVSAVVNIFSPLALDEVRRVLKPSGAFIMVIPGEEHLFELKAKIYDTPYKNKPEDTELDGFSLVCKEEIKYAMSLSTPEHISALFMMTPYAYRTSSVGRERVQKLSTLECTAHFYVLTYKKTTDKV